MRYFILWKISFVLQRQSFKLSHFFIVVIAARKVIGVKNDKRHPKVTVISNAANRVNLLDFWLHVIEVRIFKLGDGEKVSRLFHCSFKLFELLPVVVKISSICHKIHFHIKIKHKIIKFFNIILQISGLAL